MRLRSSLFGCCGLLLQLFGMVVFLRGFFPLPAKSSGAKAKASDVPAEPAGGLVSNQTQLPSPIFGRVVIMLVDALREDFVFGHKGRQFMPYTWHLVERGSSHSFIAKAWPPTVTMPRIKAMMTGKIPGFIDIIGNLNSTPLLEDNLIWQAKAAGKRIVFYGDGTWIQMFPGQFTEHDGTTPFFVPDYTEVDENVTRHLDKVLERSDWDLLILHYLGLDHLGHLARPNSPLIGQKLSEMDSVVQKLHVGLLSKEASLPSLLILCGDHGMSDTGSHGGSSNHELNTPLVFISPAFAKKHSFVASEYVEQTDLTSTLALGFGLPIPRNNLGHLIPSVLEEPSLREQLRYVHLNGYQLSLLIQESIPAYEKDAGYKLFQIALKSHGSWIKLYLEGNTSETLANLGKKVLRQYLDAVKFMSSSLSKIVAQYDMYSMIVGTIIVVEVIFLLVVSTPEALGSTAELEVPVSSPFYSLLFYLLCLMFAAIHAVVCTSTTTSCYFCNMSWLLVATVIVLISALKCVLFSTLWRRFANRKPQHKSCAADCSSWSELDLVLLLGTFGHALSLGSSSFIEEEHQTWFFLVNTLLLVFFQDACRKYFAASDPKDKAKKWNAEDDEQQTAIHGLFETSYLDPEDDKSKDYVRSGKNYEKWLVLSSPWVILVFCRVLRSLNQTGMKYAQKPDFGHWLTSSNHRIELSVLTAISLLLIFILVQRTCSFVSKAALALGLVGIYCYRAAVGNVVFPWKPDKHDVSKGIIEARFVYVFILGILFTGVKDLLKSGVVSSDTVTNGRGLWEIYNGLVLLAALLLRPHNLPVLLFILVVQMILTKFIWRTLGYDAAQITIIYYWFGQASFYFQGNSNSIATVDISAGFVGFEDYVELPAIFLTIYATYIGPLLWAVHLTCYMSSERSRYSSAAVGHSCYCFILLRAIPASVYVILITSLRYHLFIWSVFSPKLLYEGMHTFVTGAVCVMFTAMDQKRMLKT
ncbi:GPI ethanolamine phosphate transferase 2 isoform X9 [Pristis pectinata]|uniref:GPI ethanolamine phosphate transferase 2 isoform X7 n=1 Tax=Pristis pectinata TaxID=685728 RepID=UPI00223C926A|nr:GPI ethanolamine phosphate transferase 2 isoform X7 [Pristis pectinata]XP_051890518.1 GPI ethanolamine phosphate transferase 2 isoform X9 [Pristis pectinata]